MTRPQIITLELEDCSEALVKYVEKLESNQLPDGYITAPAAAWHDLAQSELRVAQLEQALAYESDWAEQALQSRKELADKVDQLQSKYDHVLQEAKIHACELDTQKSIVFELCKLFDLRVYDYHCISKVKEAIVTMREQSVRDGFIEGARQASHNEIGWFGYGVEECADLYVKEVIK